MVAYLVSVALVLAALPAVFAGSLRGRAAVFSSPGSSMEFRWGGQHGTCLDLPGGASDNGNQLQVWECLDNDNQKFFYDETTQQIRWGGNSDKCLDVLDGTDANGTKVVLWDCHPSDDKDFWHQQFDMGKRYLNPDGSVDFQIRWAAAFSPFWRCLDNYDGVVGEKSVVVWGCHESDDADFDHQLWKQSVIPAPIRWGGQQDTCLDLPGGASYNGNQLQVWACLGNVNQKFWLDQATKQIRWGGDMHKCLDVMDGTDADGTTVVIYDCHPKDHKDYWHQQFEWNAQYVHPDGSIDFQIRWAAAFSPIWRCLDNYNGIVGERSVVVWECHDSDDKDFDHQLWSKSR